MSPVSSFEVKSSLDMSGLPDRSTAAGSQSKVMLQLHKSTDLVRKTAAADGAEKTAEAAPTQASDVLVEINQTLRMASIGVQFEFDNAAGAMVVSVENVETGKLILQMPFGEVVQFFKALGKLQDLLVHQNICHKAQLTADSPVPAAVRWSRPWVAAVAADQEPSVFRPAKD